MRITFLGTGTSHGVPMIGCDCPTCRSEDPRDNRLRPSIHVQMDDGTSILVDAGPDLRQQAIRHRIGKVDAIVFTHGHADQIIGLDETRRFTGFQGPALPCYGDEATLADIRRMFAYVFDPATPRGGGLPSLELVRIEGPFRIGAQYLIAANPSGEDTPGQVYTFMCSPNEEIATADRYHELIAYSDSPVLADTALPVRGFDPSVPGWLLAAAAVVVGFTLARSRGQT